LQLVFNDLKQG